MDLETLIWRHRPTKRREKDPAGSGQLELLNRYRLLMKAARLQLERDGRDVSEVVDGDVVISKIVAWEVLAEAQRSGDIEVRSRNPRPPHVPAF